LQTSASTRDQNNIKSIENISIYPNPIKEKGILKFTLETASFVNIEFFDLTGKKVKEIKKTNLEEGEHRIEFNTNPLNEGIYICKISTNNWIKAKRIRIQY
jgi:hypothetical protein